MDPDATDKILNRIECRKSFFFLRVWNHILTWQGRPLHRPSPFCVAYVGELFAVQHAPCNEVRASRQAYIVEVLEQIQVQ